MVLNTFEQTVQTFGLKKSFSKHISKPTTQAQIRVVAKMETMLTLLKNYSNIL